MDYYIGKKLEGRYEIRELIGVGGMANVYKGYDVLENKVVAIKILRDEFAANEDFIKRFKLESKAISMLTHPNIVRVYDVTFTDRIQSIVMEYVDGITLKEYIDQEKVLKWKEAVHFTVQILRALQHAHDKGIIHRDIKPQNIMVQRDGTIKVMDFGIARFNHSEPTTCTDQVIGSVYYISPEQARGDMTDERTDVYSVGVMLFEQLTGSLPFDAADPVSVAMKQISDKPKQPRALNPAIPEALEDITLRAMQKDVALRYQSAAEMLRDIEAFKENPHIQFEYKYLEESPTRYMAAIDKNRKIATEERVAPAPIEEKPQKKNTPVVLILAGVASVLLLVIMVIGVVFVQDLMKNDDIEVPHVVGMTVAEVKLQYPDLLLDEKTAFSSDYPAGQIMEQGKPAGRGMKATDELSVTISKGPKTSTVPEVYQLPLDEAKSRLEMAGFRNYVVETNKENDPKLDDGLVTGTEPAIGAEADVEKELKIFVNPSAKPIGVPNVLQMTVEEATSLLKAAGFEVKTEEADADEAKGTVLKQSDTSALKYSTITLTVSNGKGKAKTIEVTVDLKQLKLDSEATLKAYIDGDYVSQKICIPSAAGSWVIPVSGTGTKELQVRLNDAQHTNYLYASFKVDLIEGRVIATTYKTLPTTAPTQPSVTEPSGTDDVNGTTQPTDPTQSDQSGLEN